MSKRRDEELMADILDAIIRIQNYTKETSFESFLSDEKTKDAVVRNLEIIGEAVKSVTEETKEKETSIQWHDFARVRDKLIHHYFGVNFDIVWKIIQEDLPVLFDSIENIE